MTVAIYFPLGDRRVSTNYMYPFFASRVRKDIVLLTDLASLMDRIRRSQLEAVMLVEGDKFDPAVKKKYLGVFQAAKERGARVGFFATGANPAQINREYLDIVDIYFKPTLLAAPFQYHNDYIAGKVWVDWLEAQGNGLGATAPKNAGRDEIPGVEKLAMSWNVGMGLYPRTSVTKRACTLIEKTVGPRWSVYLKPRIPRYLGKTERQRVLHARMGVHDSNPYVAHHREMLLEIAQKNVPTLVGKVTTRIYLEELRGVSAVLSPFGSGEVCWRDFEAAQCGAALIKPEMSHLRTWPDVYRPEAYFPIGWDGDGLVEAFESADEIGGRRARSAFEIFEQAYADIETRVERVLESLVSDVGDPGSA